MYLTTRKVANIRIH